MEYRAISFCTFFLLRHVFFGFVLDIVLVHVEIILTKKIELYNSTRVSVYREGIEHGDEIPVLYDVWSLQFTLWLGTFSLTSHSKLFLCW